MERTGGIEEKVEFEIVDVPALANWEPKRHSASQLAIFPTPPPRSPQPILSSSSTSHQCSQCEVSQRRSIPTNSPRCNQLF